MFILLLIYIVMTGIISKRINDKTEMAQKVVDDTKAKTQQVNEYKNLIETRTKNYKSVLEQLQEANDRASEAYRSKNAIPNLLSEIMFAIPKEAQILSIDNTEEKHITINAQAAEYQ